MEDKVKQVIVMRRNYPDGKGGIRKLRTGKMIAQACHGSLSWLTRKMQSDQSDQKLTLSNEEQAWLTESFAKVVLYVDSEEELLGIFKQCKEASLNVHLITDAGHTEFNGVPTKTCIAIGPHKSSKIDKITGSLKLL